MVNQIILKYVDPGNGFVIVTGGSWVLAVLLTFLGICGGFFKKTFFRHFKKLAIFALLIFVIFSFFILKGVIMKKAQPYFNKKVIILGLDALSPEIIEEMMRQGKLPNFSSLKENGSYRRLATTNPAQSPVAWAAFATGKNPAKNGVFDFIVRDPQTYKLRLVLSEFEGGTPKRVLREKAFWNYASEKNVPVVILNCPVTFPPDNVNGRMLSGMGVPDILGTEGTFTFYTTQILDKDKDIGGKVFSIPKAKEMELYFIGPRVKKSEGDAHLKSSFKVIIDDAKTLTITCNNKSFSLGVGQWSNWVEVVFKAGIFKRIKGICKFYLVGIEPELQLYISPIDFDPRKPLFDISYPAAYSRELADAMGLYHTRGMPMDTWPVNEGRISEEAFLEEFASTAKEARSRFAFELNRFQSGVLFCYLEEVDIAQHMLWRYFDPESIFCDRRQQQFYRDKIEKEYKKMDEIVGLALAKIRDGDTLIVVSDHGFGSFDRAVHINAWLKENGYLFMTDPSLSAGRELLSDIDWSRTKAYAIGFGAIYINQQGREGKGIVKPGQETEALKEEIAQRLTSWVDQKHKKKVIRAVYKKQDIFWGKFSGQAPDLYIGFNKGYRASWQTALGAVPGVLIEDNLKKWGGDHLFDPFLVPGVIFSNKKIERGNPTIYSLTPTILKAIGIKDGDLEKLDFDARPLF